ncbi:FAD/NAD(P)-binding domain-containing protein [Dendrothele bispora CBS 962.96]|uniref:FAD/NAD(P)-binding domain-containing protein n=1 Tax=Dendrothele bispora (strain CBS 962.96) TaxID=1314807 RepID=A0A4S8KTV6_DENBC|nr:FAD/NAD(P)-binding domain-containing protein [Dendrothele bispora CBS 962.96]
MYQTKAEHVLNFTVVGGSIGGLSAAYCIHQAGHNVMVLEKHDMAVFKSQAGSDLRVPPNMTRLLGEFPGTEELLHKCASIIPGHIFIEGSEPVGKMTYKEEMFADLGAGFYRMPYVDLWSHLYSLCSSSNIECRFNSQVTEVIIGDSSAGVSVVLDTGEHIHGDIVIGADGHNSVVRRTILENQQEDPQDDAGERSTPTNLSNVHEWITCRLSIPQLEIGKDPELQSLIENDWWTVWLSCGLFYNASREGNEYYGLNIFYPFRQFQVDDMDWNVKQTCLSPEELQSTEGEPRLKKLLSLASSCHRVNQTNYNLKVFTNKTMQLIIIGDAAHAAIMNGVHNAAIAVEDAYALGFLFSKVSGQHQVPLFLKGYNEIRQKRTKMIRESDSGVLTVHTLPPGVAHDARNEIFKKTLEKEDDEYDDIYSQIIQDYITQCNYDSKDAIEEWWHNWGRLI